AGMVDIRWHMIGHLQTNKVKQLLSLAPVIHTLDSEKLLLEVGRRAAEQEKKIDVFIQVNMDQEASKSGVSPEEVQSLVGVASRFETFLTLKGLMAIPSPGREKVRESFRGLR